MSTDIQTRKAIYVLSTHWDREWYESFQYYRFRLVQLLDRVLDGLEDGRLKGPFTTDGQAIILEDYLEIRPEREEQIKRFAKEGKLVIGPWYVLPDEFLISGESHIRNIRQGRETARSYGTEPSNAGFICDLFGHISQMPQIFKGFGIETALLWRGLNLFGKRNLVWKGADDTETVAFKFANYGYCDFTFAVRDGDKFEVRFDRDDKEKKLTEYLKSESDNTEIDTLLLFDGGDHQEWDQQLYEVISDRLGKEQDGVEITHGSLDDYAKELLSQRDRITTRFEGELREPGKVFKESSHQIHGVLSSRVWIKQQNTLCQSLLTQWAEPTGILAELALDRSYPHGYLNVAWKTLIQNHPHDSICGCSIDQVHKDMIYRFDQSREIADRITIDATKKVAASIEGDIEDKEVRMTVFNPLTSAYKGTAEFTLEIPEDYPKFGEFFGFEPKPAFRIFDSNGKEVPYQRTSQHADRLRFRIWDAKFPEPYKVHEIGVSLPVEIPATGYQTFTIKPGEENIPTRHPEDKGLAVSERAMENEDLYVRIENNGTLTIKDKRNGEVYSDVLVFEDRADIGDGWFHGVAVNDQKIYSTAAASDVALIENGPMVSTFRIRTTMNIPEDFDFQSMRRSERRVPLVIDSYVSLRPGTDYVEVKTDINNNAKDHRVRMQAATGCSAKTYFTDTPFDVVERDIELDPQNHEYMELQVETVPQQNFCVVNDGKRGLAVISTGLMETCVRDLENKPVALTLYRSTRRTVNTNGEPDGQILGPQSFSYLIKPIVKSFNRRELYRDAQLLEGTLRSVYIVKEDQEIHRQKKALPTSGSLIDVEGDAVVTSFYKAGDGYELRLFNPEPWKIDSTINLGDFATGLKNVEMVDFESNPVGDSKQAIKGNSITISLTKKQIMTLRLTK